MSDIETWSGPQKATEETQRICDEVKIKVEEQTKKKYDEFKAVEYIEWIHPCCGGGVNFIIKVHVGRESYDHLSVYANFSVGFRQFNLRGVQQHKTKDDPLVPFNV